MKEWKSVRGIEVNKGRGSLGTLWGSRVRELMKANRGSSLRLDGELMRRRLEMGVPLHLPQG